ncbi:esterase/lipase family protein [Streptomyces sp. NRRL B-24484]|uniref:esterase/lipase family protein n=1 Tax=Streptomyces sp. NRRL B-24484 TaxID=1463833 RepID=UPI0004BE9F78|nr:triacylglycerol lipase [Streptomyces sp. NRRL B-24484]
MRRILGSLFLCLAAVTAFVVPSGAAHAAGHRPVIFVHGYTGSASNWTTALSVFTAGGYGSSELYTFEYDWNQSNQTSAAQLAAYVDQVRAKTGATQVDLVNHSMGGLVTRWYVKQLGGHTKVAHWASLAGANHGTTYAANCIVYPSCQEMYPGSSFLATLNSGDETPGSTAYRTWYSPCDGVIIPYTSTAVGGATNTLVACQTHIGFLTDLTVLAQVRGFVSA